MDVIEDNKNMETINNLQNGSSDEITTNRKINGLVSDDDKGSDYGSCHSDEEKFEDATNTTPITEKSVQNVENINNNKQKEVVDDDDKVEKDEDYLTIEKEVVDIVSNVVNNDESNNEQIVNDISSDSQPQSHNVIEKSSGVNGTCDHAETSEDGQEKVIVENSHENNVDDIEAKTVTDDQEQLENNVDDTEAKTVTDDQEQPENNVDDTEAKTVTDDQEQHENSKSDLRSDNKTVQSNNDPEVIPSVSNENAIVCDDANNTEKNDLNQDKSNCIQDSTVTGETCVSNASLKDNFNNDNTPTESKEEQNYVDNAHIQEDTTHEIDNEKGVHEIDEGTIADIGKGQSEESSLDKQVSTSASSPVNSAVQMRDKNSLHSHHGKQNDEISATQVEFGIEDFGKMQKKAEQRLALRRAQREEARLIRMKELEKQQREMEEKQDRIYELTKDSSTRSYQGSRRGSDDSTSSEDTRELRKQIAELEEKYKKAMMNNAQLDNEKQTYRYQVDLLKDQFEEVEETNIETQRLLKERCRELEQKKRDYDDLHLECEYYKQQVTQRDKLIQEYGLVFISNDAMEEQQEDKKNTKRRRKKKDQGAGEEKAALVTPDALQILAKVDGNLDEKLKKMDEEHESLQSEISKLRLQLDEEKEKNAIAEKYNSPKHSGKEMSNGPIDSSMMDANMEAQKQLTEYRYKLKKAEQDITVLEGNVIRLESQVKRWKTSADDSEKEKEDMKAEKRKLQRDSREKQSQLQELLSQNENLQKRLEKFRKERIAIMGKS